ncbi:MAG: DnaJ domain-containing protein [Pyrinomonadaceae bacterium]
MRDFDRSKDYYSILGADAGASRSEIERLYKRLAVRHHPDRGGSEQLMKQLNEAYSVLRDEATRRAYDGERGKSAQTISVEEDAPPYSSPPAQIDSLTSQCLSAVFCIIVGLALLLLVRFQWMWFLWPLGILAALVVFFGIWMAHSAMHSVRDTLFSKHLRHRYTLLQEAVFWSAVCGGGYGIYLVLSSV